VIIAAEPSTKALPSQPLAPWATNVSLPCDALVGKAMMRALPMRVGQEYLNLLISDIKIL
jgi:hypothetical protein